MKASTVAALDRINRRFYDEQAQGFDQTRQGPWAGWAQVAEAVSERLVDARPLTVLDVGCGNGRFAQFLAQALPAVDIRWAGLDASGPLLERARSHARAPNLVRPIVRSWNLLGDDAGPPELPAPPMFWPGDDDDEEHVQAGFDLVVAFGVFHHVPGPLQADLFTRMVDATRSGGLVVASFWQFAELDHYASRRIPWPAAVAADWITSDALTDLDGDDWLLRWGHESELRARYCRFTNEEAAHGVAAGCDPLLKGVQWFRADGRTSRLNLYALAERS